MDEETHSATVKTPPCYPEEIKHNGDTYIDADLIVNRYQYSDRGTVSNACRRHKLPTTLLGKARRLYVHEEEFSKWFHHSRHTECLHLDAMTRDIPEVEPFLEVHAANSIVFGDVHAPFLDWFFFSKILRFAELVGATHAISAGDFWDEGAFAFWWSEKPPVDWDTEYDYGNELGRLLSKQFEQVVYLCGSHDKRLARAMANAGKRINVLLPYAKIKELPNAKVTYHQRAILNSGNREWSIEHPKNVMKCGSITGQRRQGTIEQSVIFLHGHRAGVERNFSGKEYVIQLGCVADPNKIWYHTMPAAYADWTQDFVWIKDGIPRHIYKDELDSWIADYERIKA